VSLRLPRIVLAMSTLACTSMSLACGGDQDIAPVTESTTIADSAGVRVIIHATSSSGTIRLIAADEPSVVIGEMNGPAIYQLFNVSGAAMLSGGRVVLADGGTQELRLYDSTGVFERAFGGVGDGPGEFRNLRLAGVFVGDSILAVDLTLQRAVVISGLDGGHRSFLFDRSFGRLPRPAGVLEDGRLLLRPEVVGSEPSQPALGPEVRRPVFALRLAGGNGEVALLLGDYPVNERFVSPGLAAERVFGRRLHISAGFDRIAVGTDDTYSIRVFDAAGQLDHIVRRSVTPDFVTENDKALGLANVIARFTEDWAKDRMRDALADMPWPENHPAYSDVRVDADGYVWVARYSRPWESDSTWDVYDRSGDQWAVVTLPSGIEVLHVGRELVLGLRKDSLGVERVEGYKFTAAGW